MSEWDRQHLGQWRPNPYGGSIYDQEIRQRELYERERYEREMYELERSRERARLQDRERLYREFREAMAPPQVPQLTDAGRKALASDLAKRNLFVRPEPKTSPKPTDPLDVLYDRLPLRTLLALDEEFRRDKLVGGGRAPRMQYFTEPQRLAIALHWSLQLSEKQRAARELERERERNRVVVDLDW